MTADTVVPHGFEKAPPSRGAQITCWAVDLVVAAIVWTVIAVFLGFVLALVDGDKNSSFSSVGHMKPWAATVTVLVASLAAAVAMSVGTGGRSVGHAVAELRVDGPDGHAAPAWRRIARGLIVVLVFLALAWWHIGAAIALVLLLWLPSLLRHDRRGPYEWVTGLRDYSVDPV